MPHSPAIDDTVTMCPFFFSIIPGSTDFTVQKWANVFTANVRSILPEKKIRFPKISWILMGKLKARHIDTRSK